MPERFRGEILTVGRYTNPASFSFYLFYRHTHTEIITDADDCYTDVTTVGVSND